MVRGFLGELEELILTMVGVLREDAYGNAIIREIEDQLGRQVTLAAAHVTLYRLEDKGFVKSKVGGATSIRGGRRKRLYTITPAGLAMLRSMRQDRLDLWKRLPELKTQL